MYFHMTEIWFLIKPENWKHFIIVSTAYRLGIIQGNKYFSKSADFKLEKYAYMLA